MEVRSQLHAPAALPSRKESHLPTVYEAGWAIVPVCTLRWRREKSRFQAFTTMKILVEVFWVVTPCSFAVWYQCFGGPCCLHLQGEAWRWRQHGHVKCWYPTTGIQGVTTRKTWARKKFLGCPFLEQTSGWSVHSLATVLSELPGNG
jgi:hypothetical protein